MYKRQKLIDGAHTQAARILTKHRRVLDSLAEALIEHETLDTPELMEILEVAGKKVSAVTAPRPAPRPVREAKPVAKRRPGARSCSPSARIPTATACSTRPPAWLACTTRSWRASARTPRPTSR